MNDNGNGTGYNPGKIQALGEEVKAAAKSACSSIETHVQTDIIDKMANAWFAGEAIDYFKNTLKPSVASTGDSIRTDLFNKFIENLVSAGEEWKKATQNDGSGEAAAADVSIEQIGADEAKIDVNVEGIKEQDGDGFIGIKDSEFSDVINSSIPDSKNSVKAEVEALKDTLHSSDAYVGGEQGAAVDGFFDKIVAAVIELYDKIAADLNTVFTEHQTQNTKDAETNASAWSGSSVTINTN